MRMERSKTLRKVSKRALLVKEDRGTFPVIEAKQTGGALSATQLPQNKLRDHCLVSRLVPLDILPPLRKAENCLLKRRKSTNRLWMTCLVPEGPASLTIN